MLEGGRIAEDMPCLCGYNLRTMEYAGRRPECGKAVEQAERMHRVRLVEQRDGAAGNRFVIRFYLSVWAFGAFTAAWTALEAVGIPIPYGILSILWGVTGVCLLGAGFLAMCQLIVISQYLLDRQTTVESRHALSFLINPVVVIVLFLFIVWFVDVML